MSLFNIFYFVYFNREEAKRMERRERDKLARAKMFQTNQKNEPEELFQAPFRVGFDSFLTYFTCLCGNHSKLIHFFLQRKSPTESDRLIEMKLGDYQSLKSLIQNDQSGCFIGVSASQRRSTSSSLPQQQLQAPQRNFIFPIFDLSFLNTHI